MEKFFLEMNQSETRIACGADISKIQDNLSDIRSGNLEKLWPKENLFDRIKTYIFRIAIKNSFICLTCKFTSRINF
jgi:hypothetical protein